MCSIPAQTMGAQACSKASSYTRRVAGRRRAPHSISQPHQWGDYTQVWDRIGVARHGQAPESHIPLLSPGAVVAGAVLEGTRRVTDTTAIERTLPTVTFHPLTLYRMGLVDLASATSPPS